MTNEGKFYTLDLQNAQMAAKLNATPVRLTSAWPGGLCTAPAATPSLHTAAGRLLCSSNSAKPPGWPRWPRSGGTGSTSRPSAAPQQLPSTAWSAVAPCSAASGSAGTMPPPPGQLGGIPLPLPPRRRRPPPPLQGGTIATISAMTIITMCYQCDWN